MRNESSRHGPLCDREYSCYSRQRYFLPVLLEVNTGSAQESSSSKSIPIADAHFHLLDFLQNSAYLDPQSGEEIPPVAVTQNCLIIRVITG